MDMVFNPRGTGACPLCKKLPHCSIRKDIQKTLATMPGGDGKGGEKKAMEIVIYVCPYFVETA